jgi:hypothetical protein
MIIKLVNDRSQNERKSFLDHHSISIHLFLTYALSKEVWANILKFSNFPILEMKKKYGILLLSVLFFMLKMNLRIKWLLLNFFTAYLLKLHLKLYFYYTQIYAVEENFGLNYKQFLKYKFINIHK